MASLAEIQKILEDIRADLPALVQRSQIAPVQIVIGEGLSDISKRLGLVQAGEFRTGNGLEPGRGFTGMRIGYPAFKYGGKEYHLVGVNNDFLQIGISATTGKLTIVSETYPAPSITPIEFVDNVDGLVIGNVLGWHLTSDSGVYLIGIGKNGSFVGHSGIVATTSDDPTFTNTVALDIKSDGWAQFDFQKGRIDTTGSQALVIASNIRAADNNLTNINLYLDSYNKTTPVAGFGTGISLRAENNNSEMMQIGYILASYRTVTDNAEQSIIKFGTKRQGSDVEGIYIEDGAIKFLELVNTPLNPGSGIETHLYMRSDKLIIQYNDGGTVRYKYLDLTGTGVTWVHTTTAP